MTKIAVDVDSTLYDFEPALRQAYLDLALKGDAKEELFRGAYQSWVEWRSPSDVCGSEAFEEALAIVHSPEVILSQSPFPGAAWVCQDLEEQGHELIYVSAREEWVWGPTKAWLSSTGFPKGDLICSFEDKVNLVRDCRYIIDDRPKTLVQFTYDWQWKLKHGSESVPRQGFGLLYEYNRALTDVPNVWLAPTWGGLRYYLEREGVLDGSHRSTNTGSLA